MSSVSEPVSFFIRPVSALENSVARITSACFVLTFHRLAVLNKNMLICTFDGILHLSALMIKSFL